MGGYILVKGAKERTKKTINIYNSNQIYNFTKLIFNKISFKNKIVNGVTS